MSDQTPLQPEPELVVLIASCLVRTFGALSRLAAAANLNPQAEGAETWAAIDRLGDEVENLVKRLDHNGQ